MFFMDLLLRRGQLLMAAGRSTVLLPAGVYCCWGGDLLLLIGDPIIAGGDLMLREGSIVYGSSTVLLH